MEQGPPIPTKLHEDSTDSDQTVALTQSDPSESLLALLDGVCTYAIL